MADIVEAGHEVFGHGMYHEPALAGRPFAEQRHEMRRMRDSIEAACGVRVRGIGCPHHGMADANHKPLALVNLVNTLRAAVEMGIEYEDEFTKLALERSEG